MSDAIRRKEKNGEQDNSLDRELYGQCLRKAEGDEQRALTYYRHRIKREIEPKPEDLDRAEKWPMLTPLLILYGLGTVGVLGLVYGFLANRLGW